MKGERLIKVAEPRCKFNFLFSSIWEGSLWCGTIFGGNTAIWLLDEGSLFSFGEQPLRRGQILVAVAPYTAREKCGYFVYITWTLVEMKWSLLERSNETPVREGPGHILIHVWFARPQEVSGNLELYKWIEHSFDLNLGEGWKLSDHKSSTQKTAVVKVGRAWCSRATDNVFSLSDERH